MTEPRVPLSDQADLVAPPEQGDGLDGFSLVSLLRITFAMAGAVGLGLWLGEVTLTSSARWSASDRVWSELVAGFSDSTPVRTEGNNSLGGMTRFGQLDENGHLRVTDSKSAGNLVWEATDRTNATGELQFGDLVDHRGSRYPAVTETSGSRVAYVDRTRAELEAASVRAGTPWVIGFIIGWVAIVQFGILFSVSYRGRRRRYQENDRFRHREQLHERELGRTRNAVIFGLAKLAESRDPDTGLHLERITQFAKRLTIALRRSSIHRERITSEFIRLIEFSAALHDIGKVGVEDSILLKPGQLSERERTRMQIHPIVGGNCIAEIEKRLGTSNFLEMAREITMYHHERWDGTGYPSGLAGNDIPLPARIVAVADVYDALSTRRAYKEAMPHERCVEIIREGRGSQFDPTIVDIFLEIEREFRQIAAAYTDHTATPETISGENFQASPTRLPAQIIKLMEDVADANDPETELDSPVVSSVAGQ